MSSALPFVGPNPRPSPWGFNWTAEDVPQQHHHQQEVSASSRAHQQQQPSSPDPMAEQLAHMPAALLSTLKREKKPFTYTPGGVNLNEVLNARLQKRMERKKRYSEERVARPDNGLPRFDPPKQVVVMPTYNTPLNMYSMENALEMLEMQAEMATADKRSATLPRNHTFHCEDSDRGVAQSKAFRVLQIMTDTDDDAPESPRPHHRDEMRFSGVRDSSAIPSKFFHTLQKITGTDKEDEATEQPHQRHRPVVDAVRAEQQHQQQQQQQHQYQQPPPPPLHQGTTTTSFAPARSNFVPQQPQRSPSFCTLKRPAAFLPSPHLGSGLTPPGFRPVQPAPCANGSISRKMASAGTDF